MSKTEQGISTLFFDLDGTLTDPREGITRCYQYSLEQLGYSYPTQDELVQYIGPPLRCGLPKLLGSEDEELIDAGVRHYRDRFSQVGHVLAVFGDVLGLRGAELAAQGRQECLAAPGDVR